MFDRPIAKCPNLLGGLALAASGVLAASVPQDAHASTWGCQVILCLATPGSPTTYAECVPPITRLWKALAMGGSFPSCSEGGVSAKTKKLSKTLYYVRSTQSDGTTSAYLINTKTSTVTTVGQ
ncbi:hypothetical protein [Novosphingobium sp. PP1Y]|uniref:hypothetical protein n=1 Tax=Novosphingobium sp. PP1Y TaxID=702113 RepID=UPI00020EEE7D|nr:hypothetical protein [Novosphingobium sp. PP1Y]CCA89797.1 conserved hypothetical protein [Novosphingobium sp. PP1Y]